jgi:hypothetical protein
MMMMRDEKFFISIIKVPKIYLKTIHENGTFKYTHMFKAKESLRRIRMRYIQTLCTPQYDRTCFNPIS